MPVLGEGPQPRYYRLARMLRERILSGAAPAGERLPTFQELCECYGVSRSVVVQALSLLDREGLLERHQGKGIFVADPGLKLEQGAAQLLSFTDEITRRGHTPSSRILRLAREPAPPTVAEALGLQPGDLVVVVERLRLADGHAMGFQRAYLPERLFPGLADLQEPIESLYQLLQRRFGVVPTTATDTYEATQLDRAMARHLEQPPGCPAFRVCRRTRDQHRRPIEWVESIYRGDRYKVTLELERSSPRPL